MALTELHGVADALDWLTRQGARGLSADSRRVAAGDAFIAWPGQVVDGRRFLAPALQAGAVACLIEREGAEAFLPAAEHPAVATLRGLKACTGALASAFWREPSRALQVLAVTGTNGKTSTAWWLAQALNALGRRCGVVGTLGIGQPPHELVHTGLTTPDPVTLHAALRRFVDQGFAACAMEASSIGLSEHRLDGVAIEVGLFTNFTQDHLDYHGDMARYWAAKAALFAWPGLRAAVVNVDDAQGAALAAELGQASGGPDLWSFSMHRPARLQARGWTARPGETGLGFEVLEEGGAAAGVHTRLIGEYNIANLLAVIGGLRALGVPLAEAAAACGQLSPVPGRMQRVQLPGTVRGPEVIVDYAHTPDALEKALRALRPLAQARGGKLWCVFGCGGNRDAGKRAVMGAQAQRWADQVVVTSDNPRDEPPQHILRQIVAGMAPTPTTIEDRAEAIAHAVREAGDADLILLAGKGHEDYQEVAGVKRPFSDVAQARAALALKENATS